MIIEHCRIEKLFQEIRKAGFTGKYITGNSKKGTIQDDKQGFGIKCTELLIRFGKIKI